MTFRGTKLACVLPFAVCCLMWLCFELKLKPALHSKLQVKYFNFITQVLFGNQSNNKAVPHVNE